MSATARVMMMTSPCQAWPSPLRLKTSFTSKKWATDLPVDGDDDVQDGGSEKGGSQDISLVLFSLEIQQWLVDRTSGERRLWNRLHPQSSEAWKRSHTPGAESQTGQVTLQVRSLLHLLLRSLKLIVTFCFFNYLVLFILMSSMLLCCCFFLSKLGANSSSSLGEVVPNSRKSTPPSSGKWHHTSNFKTSLLNWSFKPTFNHWR